MVKRVGQSGDWSDRLYLTTLLRGLRVTFGGFWGRKMTIRYPEEEPRAADPGLPRLKRNEQGEVQCVACHLCSTACPAACIEIEAVAVADGENRFPQRFEIDALRCIFCGCCVEACPVAAIDMGPQRPLAAKNRRELLFNREKLLAG